MKKIVNKPKTNKKSIEVIKNKYVINLNNFFILNYVLCWARQINIVNDIIFIKNEIII